MNKNEVIEIRKKMKEAEDIIISKRFFELSPGELEVVKEFASNEEDYDAMRWFLQSTRASLAKEKVEASSSLRKNVMAHLHQAPAQKTIWLNGAMAFLFPREKKFYQAPAFQMAAVGLLLIGFVFMYDGSLKEDQGVAQNLEEQPLTEDISTPAESVPAESSTLSAGEAVSADQGEADKNPQDGSTIESEIAPVPEQVDLPEDARTEEYKEMSVAEEGLDLYANGSMGTSNSYTYQPANEKASGEELRTVVVPEYRGDADKNKNNAAGKVVAESEKSNKKDNLGRNETSKNELGNSTTVDEIVTTHPGGSGSVTTGPATTGTTVPTTTTIAGNITVTDADLAKEKNEKEGGLFLTATAGAVYGDTASLGSDDENGVTGGYKPDADVPASQFSINDSKELKALFFIVK